jgi:hypothetical protein
VIQLLTTIQDDTACSIIVMPKCANTMIHLGFDECFGMIEKNDCFNQVFIQSGGQILRPGYSLIRLCSQLLMIIVTLSLSQNSFV